MDIKKYITTEEEFIKFALTKDNQKPWAVDTGKQTHSEYEFDYYNEWAIAHDQYLTERAVYERLYYNDYFDYFISDIEEEPDNYFCGDESESEIKEICSFKNFLNQCDLDAFLYYYILDVEYDFHSHKLPDNYYDDDYESPDIFKIAKENNCIIYSKIK